MFRERLYETGKWEPETRTLIEEMLQPGDLFVDIGAWIGPVTLWALERGANVIAIEPDPVALRELRSRVPASVEIWEGAVGVATGTAVLRAPRLGMSGSSLHPETPGKAVQVRTWTLREILAGRKPALVKIDIEGYEIELLPTIASYLADNGVPMQIELHGTLPDRGWFDGYSDVYIPDDTYGMAVIKP